MLKDIVTSKLVTMESDAKVSEAAKLMEREDVGCVLVLENNRPRGLITDRDIVLRCIAKNVDVDDCTVENVMSESVHCVHETDGIFDCIQMMRDNEVRRVPIINDQGEAVGVVSFGDLLGLLSKELYQLTSTCTPADQELEERAAA